MTEGALEWQRLMLASCKDAQQIGDTWTNIAAANVTAAWAAVQEMAGAKTIPEATRIYTNFVQSQFAKSTEQAREFFDLSSDLSGRTLKTLETAGSNLSARMREVA